MNAHDVYLIVVAVITTRVHMWLKNKIRERKGRLAWEYSCIECSSRGDGTKFSCEASEVAALDAMIIAHRTASHSGG